jgi:hypothetical protein
LWMVVEGVHRSNHPPCTLHPPKAMRHSPASSTIQSHSTLRQPSKCPPPLAFTTLPPSSTIQSPSPPSTALQHPPYLCDFLRRLTWTGMPGSACLMWTGPVSETAGAGRAVAVRPCARNLIPRDHKEHAHTSAAEPLRRAHRCVLRPPLRIEWSLFEGSLDSCVYLYVCLYECTSVFVCVCCPISLRLQLGSAWLTLVPL